MPDLSSEDDAAEDELRSVDVPHLSSEDDTVLDAAADELGSVDVPHLSSEDDAVLDAAGDELGSVDVPQMRPEDVVVEPEEFADVVQLMSLLVEAIDVFEAKSVVLLPNLEEDESQSTGILFPSSSSNDSGARVQAGASDEVELPLIELLSVTFVVMVEAQSTAKHPLAVTSKGVWHEEKLLEEVITAVDSHVENNVVADTAEDKSTDSLQRTILSVAVLKSSNPHFFGPFPDSVGTGGLGGILSLGIGPGSGPPLGQRILGHSMHPFSPKQNPKHPKRPHVSPHPQKKQGSGNSPKRSMKKLSGKGKSGFGHPGPQGKPIKPHPRISVSLVIRTESKRLEKAMSTRESYLPQPKSWHFFPSLSFSILLSVKPHHSLHQSKNQHSIGGGHTKSRSVQKIWHQGKS